MITVTYTYLDEEGISSPKTLAFSCDLLLCAINVYWADIRPVVLSSFSLPSILFTKSVWFQSLSSLEKFPIFFPNIN